MLVKKLPQLILNFYSMPSVVYKISYFVIVQTQLNELVFPVVTLIVW